MKKIYVLSGRQWIGGSCARRLAATTYGTFSTYEKAREFQTEYMNRKPALYARTEFIIFEETLDPEFTE